MIGIDIINIDRIAKLISQSHFVASKIFCEQEWQYYMYSGSRVETLAGMFCAKESFVKAMGCGFGDISMTDVCVCHTNLGQPYIVASNKARELLCGKIPQLSISHSGSVAVAVCVLL